MSYWMEEPPERDAKLVEKTLKRGKAGITQLQVIVEIACASSPNHLMAVRQAYCSLFDCSLEEAITSKVSSSLQKVVHSLRYTSQNIYGFVISLSFLYFVLLIIKKICFSFRV